MKAPWLALLGLFSLVGCTSRERYGAVASNAGGPPVDMSADHTRPSDAGAEPIPDAGRTDLDAGALPSPMLALRDLENASERGFFIRGQDLGDGASLAPAGDVNGDGLADVIIGAPGDPFGNASAPGKAFVVFGSRTPSGLSLAALGSAGFVINGLELGDGTGSSVSGAGDVNGDGLDDVVISSPAANQIAGAAYVVFGKVDGSPVSLSALGAGGFVINGAVTDADAIPPTGEVVASVSAAGDVNGDGLDDVVIGSAQFLFLQGVQASGAYVVFGQTGTAPVSLSALGEAGFRIEGTTEDDPLWVSGAGDVNGDGLDDVIVTSAFFGGSAAHVVFGRRGTDAVSLASLAASAGGGFRIAGVGESVASAGDVDGDGLDDVIVSSAEETPPGGGYSGLEAAGMLYVVFGKADTADVTLSLLEAGRPGGFVMNGAHQYGSVGSGRGAGDFDGDGLDDLLVGPAFDALGIPTSPLFQVRYIVSGKGLDTLPVALAELERGEGGGLAIGTTATSASEFDELLNPIFPIWGSGLAGVGDMNGDGLDDVAISDVGYDEAGRTYVVFGAERVGIASRLGERSVLLGGPGDDLLDDFGAFNFVLNGGNGLDTLRYVGAERTLDLRLGRRTFQSLLDDFSIDEDGTVGGTSANGEVLDNPREHAPFFRAPPARRQSIEVIDLTAAPGTTLSLDDTAVRGLPQSRAGLPGGLAKLLVIRGGTGDVLRVDLSQYEIVETGVQGTVYRRRGAFYGLQIAPGITLL